MSRQSFPSASTDLVNKKESSLKRYSLFRRQTPSPTSIISEQSVSEATPPVNYIDLYYRATLLGEPVDQELLDLLSDGGKLNKKGSFEHTEDLETWVALENQKSYSAAKSGEEFPRCK